MCACLCIRTYVSTSGYITILCFLCSVVCMMYGYCVMRNPVLCVHACMWLPICIDPIVISLANETVSVIKFLLHYEKTVVENYLIKKHFNDLFSVFSLYQKLCSHPVATNNDNPSCSCLL